MTPSSPNREDCTSCDLVHLGSSQLVLNVSGLDLSKQDVVEIIQREQEKAAAAINEALTELSAINHKRRLLNKYESQLSSWYANERRYVKDHSPSIMASLMTSEDPVASAISKTKELYLALHPKPDQPFPNMEDARREVDQYDALHDEDPGVEVLREVEEEIRNQPERKAWLVGAESLKEKLSTVTRGERLPKVAGDYHDSAKLAVLAAKSPSGDLKDAHDSLSPLSSLSGTGGGTSTPTGDFDFAKTGDPLPVIGKSVCASTPAGYSPSASDNN